MSEVPGMVILPIFCSIPAYLLTGLSSSDNYSHMIIFCLCAIFTAFAITSLFHLIMLGFKNEFYTISLMPLLMFLMANFSGFSVPFDKIPWVLRWIYYINPITYGHRILAVNEFLSGDYGVQGEAYLKMLNFPTSKDDMWIWFLVLLIMHIVCIFYNIIRCIINNSSTLF